MNWNRCWSQVTPEKPMTALVSHFEVMLATENQLTPHSCQ
jgi:hypothetical protein